MAKRTRKGSRRKFHLTIERDADGNYVGSVAELKGCHTQARSIGALFARIEEAIELCLEVADSPMASSKDVPIRGFKWIATNPGKFGGKPIVRGTRFTVSFMLGCLAEEMTYKEIVREYSEFPKDSIKEILRFASLVADQPHGPLDNFHETRRKVSARLRRKGLGPKDVEAEIEKIRKRS